MRGERLAEAATGIFTRTGMKMSLLRSLSPRHLSAGSLAHVTGFNSGEDLVLVIEDSFRLPPVYPVGRRRDLL